MVSVNLRTISEALFSAAFFIFQQQEEEEEKVPLLHIAEEIVVEFTTLETSCFGFFRFELQKKRGRCNEKK